MNQALSATRKQKILRETKDYLMIALGMVMYGIGWTAFLLVIFHRVRYRVLHL